MTRPVVAGLNRSVAASSSGSGSPMRGTSGGGFRAVGTGDQCARRRGNLRHLLARHRRRGGIRQGDCARGPTPPEADDAHCRAHGKARRDADEREEGDETRRDRWRRRRGGSRRSSRVRRCPRGVQRRWRRSRPPRRRPCNSRSPPPAMRSRVSGASRSGRAGETVSPPSDRPGGATRSADRAGTTHPGTDRDTAR